MPSFYNTPMQPTRPTVAAPPIKEYREALYDEALPDDPAARMQEMKGRFDRLVRELGVSPRGPPPSGTSKFNTASSPRLPKVPSSKAWGSTPRRSKKKGADEDASSAKMLTGLALELARKEAELRVQYGLGDDKAGGDPRRASKYGTARSSGAARSKR